MKFYKWTAIIAVILGLGAVLYFAAAPSGGTKPIRFGITPYQDTALPVVAAKKGWYREEGLEIEFVPLAWGDVMTALSSGAIDAAIYNFNSFLAPYENAAKLSPKPVYYAPLYLFKAQAIMVHGNRGFETLAPVTPLSQSGRPASDVARVAAQLKGKRIALTKATELEQIVVEALKRADLAESDVEIIHASIEDSLAAFLAKDVDAFAAGLTERVEARRHGAVELLTAADVIMPVIDGLVTTDAFAAKNPEALDKLVRIWFRTIRYIKEDVKTNSQEVRDYLRTAASTRYSPEEYAMAWTFSVYPDHAAEADAFFNTKDAPFFWKTAWDGINGFLLEEKKASAPAPYSAYLGEETLGRLAKEGSNYTNGFTN